MKESFSKRLIITVISLAILTFMGIFSETSLAIVSPALMTEFTVSAVAVQWLTSGFLLLLAVAIPLSPFLVKTFATKSLFTFAIVTFIIGTVIGAFAINFEMLLAGRLIMAIGTGCSLPLLTNIVLEEASPSQRGALLGIVGLVVNFAPITGPVLGGLIAEYLSWRWVFLFMLPILFISFFMGRLTIRDIRKSNSKYNLDVKSFLASSAGLILFILGLSNLSNKFGIAYITVSFLFLALFIYIQLTVKYPLINIRILKHKMFSLGLITVCVPMASVLALAFLFPISAQRGLYQDAFHASLLILPGSLAGGLLAPLMGSKYNKYGIRKMLIPGYIIVITSLIFMMFDDFSIYTIMFGYLFFLTGVAFMQVPALTNALNALPQEYNADGTAILSTLQQTAGAAGTAISSVLLSFGVMAGENKLVENAYIYGSYYSIIFCFILAIIGFLVALRLKTTIHINK